MESIADFERRLAEHRNQLAAVIEYELRIVRAQCQKELKAHFEFALQQLQDTMRQSEESARRRFDEGMQEIQRLRQAGDSKFKFLDLREWHLREDFERSIEFNQALLDDFIRRFQPQEASTYRTQASRS